MAGRATLFGSSVSISGNTVVVGAGRQSRQHPQGEAYVFTEPGSGWANMTQTAMLTASNGRASDCSAVRFRSTARRWWSAPDAYATVGGNQKGAAYVFTSPAPVGRT